MIHTCVINVSALQTLPSDSLVLLDCRFRMDDPDYGMAAWHLGHLPGAHYLNLDYHLSGVKTGDNGRHPLPDAQRLAVDLGGLGIGPGTQVIAYDDASGQYAARAWWLLRWMGHRAVAVLDGGLPAWVAAGGSMTTAAPDRRSRRFILQSSLAGTVDAEQVRENIDNRDFVLVDARSAERFRGIGETLDPVAGHIPGALNRCFLDNLDTDGRFKPAAQLQAEWRATLGDGIAAGQVVHQCGSGVTACVNLLAMEYAGLGGSRLYPGSWSEWCSDPSRPVA
ncbi:sulfurtransferase [Paludibacterium yongneupense]|uniref:sulfurtransferase n=1 Tax=Paludibacterium yongneupense TaxID=400061 RepID=UPI0003F71987|nr:sulfurtransferase [Paludibacterium yongneupense]